MAQYAIGDLQGCYDPFRRLLDKLEFDPDCDQIWLTGDLVNRGPRSYQTLRYVKSLGSAAITVLGNHDLHLLALTSNVNVRGAQFESLQEILKADDCDELVDWLRARPLAHYSETLGTLMVHAGVPAQWSVKQALTHAREVEVVLRSASYPGFLENMYGDKPDCWSEKLDGDQRLRFIVNALTRMRMVDHNNRIDFSHSGPPDKTSNQLVPWFNAGSPKWRGTRIVFGHWSALGLMVNDDLIAVDTGCVWGRQLTAVQLDSLPTITSVQCSG